MERNWSKQELADHWSLGFEDLARIEAKSSSLRIGFAAQLKFYQICGQFPATAGEIPDAAVAYLGDQLGRPVVDLFEYDWPGRNGQRHRLEVLSFLGVRALQEGDLEALQGWLETQVGRSAGGASDLSEAIDRWCWAHKVRPPSPSVLQRLIRSASRRFESALLRQISAALAPETIARMDIICEALSS